MRIWARRLMRILVVALAVVALAQTPAGASLSSAIENTVKGWFNSAGKLVRFRFAPSAAKTVPTGYCDLYLDSTSLSLIGQCGGGSPTVIIPLSTLGCNQDTEGNLTCNSFSSTDQNSLSVPAANRWRLFDNDVDLTPNPTCANYGQSGIVTILDKDESAVDNYVLCDGTTELASISNGVQPFTTWAEPFGGGSTSVTAALAGDTCTCFLMPLAQPIADLDTVSVIITTADAGADETTNIGIYSLDGATQYFTAALTDTATGAINSSNGTAAPGAMKAGQYWLCFGYNNGASKDLRMRSAQQDAIRGFSFTQACSGGTLPATLTSPTGTAGNLLQPTVTLLDE